MGKLLPDEINELIDLVSESIKDDSKLEDIKSNIEELSKIFTLNNYKMFYSRDLKIYEEKGFQRLGIVDPKINELIMLQQGAGGSHYLQGESKDKKREVKVSNRAIDTGKDGEVIVRFDDENVIWGDIK